MNGTPAIELRKINKRFGPVHANRNIDLVVKKGSIHGIIGENGAGKSTLMSILYGFYHADDGDIVINGNKVSIPDSKSAISLGIGMVHQHFMLVDNFSVLENVILGAEGGARLAGGVDKARQELRRLEEEYELRVDPDAIVQDLPVGLQQRVEILKALFRGADILILDEPTGVLTPAEADHLFKILEVLRDEGKTVLLITHKLREIMAITDTVSVMRRGEMVATRETSQTSMSELAELMVGRSVLLRVEKEQAQPSDTVLAIENLTVTDSRGVQVVKDVSFEVRAGEIVGIAGVSGNGQSELLETLAGIRRATSGTLRIGGQVIDLADRIIDPAEMRQLSMGHVPEDRHRMGLVTSFPEYENAILGYHHDPEYSNGVFLDLAAIKKTAQTEIERYDIRPPNPLLKTANFSGGNQQKIVLAREIERDPQVLLVGQPTRGVDIGAIEFIHKRLIEMRDAAKGVLLVSVELDEIRGLSDRILVMFDGRIVGERGPDASEGELGLLMAGVEGEAS
ncbi:nucleoside ABC transporter ATP-binding protein [Roseibium hamelinense]|uniref:Nucleoside ABC transporter ATP-binding protein n=1 Tax=Roseibium hamelinense TaxID=150831 RepID=A0A562SHR4_9HYPH|nr:ABC transporter ATP-binding protein [Roseibium hamelinense]MTI43943.1 ABC transporter ATP-binding protein [Roseibium hamelinense]TWI80762.1 nucleoside ABC transporter ATP-binding protein [Roseibium hamelinense]